MAPGLAGSHILYNSLKKRDKRRSRYQALIPAECIDMKGIYILLLKLDRPEVVLAGRKRQFALQEGCYGYVGSALSGLENRVRRHLSPTKKLHWHIDFLLATARIQKIICAETDKQMECRVAQSLSKQLAGVTGFGCSDCKCQSHLFYCKELSTLEIVVFDAVKSLELTPLVIEQRSSG